MENNLLNQRKERLEYVFNTLVLNKKVKYQKDFAKLIGRDKSNVSQAFKGNPIYLTEDFLKDVAKYVNFTTEDWLLYGENGEVYETDNNNGNHFIELSNGQYLMIMPTVGVEVQARYLDSSSDVEFIAELPKHSIIVDDVKKGSYVAFVVSGDSMDNGLSNAIMAGDVVATRELQRVHWRDKIRYKDFPNWIIYTTKSAKPLLKQIVSHDTDTGMIVCHSLNDSPEYSDFELNLNDVNKLFYVIRITR